MYIASSTPPGLLTVTTLFLRTKTGSKHFSNVFRSVFSKKPNKLAVLVSAKHRAQPASSKTQRSAHTTKAERDPVTVGPEPQLPLLPLSLLGTLAAAWCFTSRGSITLQCSTLLLLDIVYAGLHLRPLLPLFHMGRTPHAFMHSYTKATYFVSECLLLGWLLSNGVVRASIPFTVLALHGAVHIGFVVLAAQAPGWCMQQQVQRINNGWNVKGLMGQWHVLVNMVNFADLVLHMCYISVLWQSLAGAGSPNPLMQEPLKLAVVGVMLAYLMAQWLPQQQHGQGN